MTNNEHLIHAVIDTLVEAMSNAIDVGTDPADLAIRLSNLHSGCREFDALFQMARPGFPLDDTDARDAVVADLQHRLEKLGNKV